MTVEEFRKTMAETEYIPAGSALHRAFHDFSQEALKITAELNSAYHTPEEIRALMSRLTAGEIESAVMVLHGEKAHSRYFGEDAFKMLRGDNKELVIVPGASHCDLYDGGGKDAIPFDRIEAFYRNHLK